MIFNLKFPTLGLGIYNKKQTYNSLFSDMQK